jgi:putative hydrolase of the HAD superfamily
MAARIEWVLFDWGNVLVDYRPLGMAKLARELATEPAALLQFASTTQLFKDLTTGALSPETALERMAQRFGVTLTRAQVAECFRADVEYELPGIRSLLAEIDSRGSYRRAILSNAFFGHWDNFEGSELYGLFELAMSSHLIGASKPSRAAFETALARMRTEPARVVFIDDKPANVEAALALGMHAFVTDSVATTRKGLAALIDIAS